METKQHATGKQTCQRGNHKGNYKIAETNDKGNKTIQNLWDIAKTVLRTKFTAIQALLSKQEKSQVNNLT